MSWKRTIVLIVLAGCLPGCRRDAGDAAASARRMRADIAYLAADDLEGRGTPSRGLDLAALYLETQLMAAGVAPALAGSYRQTYAIGTYAPAEAEVTVRINGRVVNSSDYVFLNIGRDPARGPISLPMVDVGNGIVAEEKNVDDLSAHELKGKAAVARKGAPWPLDPLAAFGPDRAIGKVMAATVRGAEMLVYLSEDLDTADEAECKFMREMKNAPVGFVREKGLEQASALNPILVLKPSAYPGGSGGRIDIAIDARVQEGRASNVLGRIEGTEAALRDEWVVLSAHYDHLGARPAAPGEDGIWNGADDNASGTAAVLEMARDFARRPGKRGVLAFFTSGEDRGIFGSAFYATQPTVPMGQVAVQINMDMIGRSQGKVQAIAPCAPVLFEEAARLAGRHGIEVVPDQQPTWRLIYLTDAYPFARADVPSVFFFTGTHPDYHQPSDTADKIRYDEMGRIVTVALEMARSYADGKPKPAFERPKWFVTP